LKCLFTGKETNSSEHVIPRWLQARFNLSNKTLVVPNGTTLKYQHHQVPADREANNRFGAIEERISRGVLDPAEVYLWALKIHIGCIYRDASLRFDIKDPASPFMLDVSDFSQEVWLFQQLYDVWAKGGKTDPSPFGSVFIVDSPHVKPDFDFMHCLVTGTIGIDIGDKFIFVVLWDQGDGMHANILKQWQWHAQRLSTLADPAEREAHGFFAPHVWACESAYWLYRHRRGLSMMKTPTQIVLVPPAARREGRPHQEAEYRQVCRNFGLDLVTYNGETNNLYTQIELPS